MAMRRPLHTAIGLAALALSSLTAQGQQAPGRLSVGSELIAGPGAVFGPTLGFRILQREHTALDAQFDALWQVGSEGPRACRNSLDCDTPRPASAAQLTALGLRWTLEISDDIYGVVAASLSDVRWAQPRETRFTSGRIGMGNGVIINRYGDAVELRVDAINTPDGSDFAFALGYRRVPRRAAAAEPARQLGGLRERTVRTDLRRTVSRVNFEVPGDYDAKVSGNRGIAPAVSVRQRTASRISVEGGLALVEKGYGKSENLRMDYAELSLLANLEFSRPEARLQWFVGGGLAPALLLSCSESNAALYGSVSQRCGETRLGTNEPQDYSKFDLSRELRAGARFRVGPGRIVGLLSTSTSLLNVNPGSASPREKTTHTVGSWGIGYERSF